MNQVGGRGLAVGSGDSDNAELASRVVVVGGGDLRQRRASVVDADNGELRMSVGDWLPELTAIVLNNKRRRPIRNGRFEVTMAVDGESRNGDKQVARVELAGILTDSADRARGTNWCGMVERICVIWTELAGFGVYCGV